jgi:hypothetical protein
VVPVFTAARSTEEEPGSVPAASSPTPQTFNVTSPTMGFTTLGFPTPVRRGRRPVIGTHRSRPRSVRFEPV